MDYHSAKDYLLGKPAAIEDYPFGPDVMVPKVQGKMFATLSEQEGVGHMNLKCDPLHARELRDLFAAIQPGYHMNKLHWNTVILDGSIPEGEIERMVDHSYALVVKTLRAAERRALEVKYGASALYRE